MSSNDGPTRALDAALTARGCDRDRAERSLAAALSKSADALRSLEAGRQRQITAQEKASAVWNQPTTVARLQVLRASSTAQLEDAAHEVELAESTVRVANKQVESARQLVRETSAAEEAIQRVLEARRVEARRTRIIRAEEDAE